MPTNEELRGMARAARKQAFAPYSGFTIGAAIKTPTGKVHTGANVEMHGRRSFHAEEVSCIRMAASSGGNGIATIAVSCEDGGGHVPCGRCLGVISEFTDDCMILLDEGEDWTVTWLREELPNAYTGDRQRL